MLKNKKLLTIVSPNFDDLELWYPIIRLREEGATVIVAGELGNHTYTGKYGVSVNTDLSFTDVKIEEYDGILIPGGWAPDYLRRLPEVLEFVRYMDKHKKLITHICHAGWVLVSAGILKGVRTTSTPAIKDDLINAGANWVNEGTVVDGHIISARNPGDLPTYLPAIINALK